MLEIEEKREREKVTAKIRLEADSDLLAFLCIHFSSADPTFTAPDRPIDNVRTLRYVDRRF